MPLSFLNPWLWMGLLGVAAPIWLHLRRRRETNLVRFSAVRFLEDQPEPRRSPWRLRGLLLFVLRVLALTLVVGAFTWPYLRGVDGVPIKESRVYILDNTLSHQANGGFARDRARLLDGVRRAGPDVQVAVIELTSKPRVAVTFGDDRQTALSKLEALEASHQRGAYLAAFRQAQAMLTDSFGERKRIIFLGDNQANQWSENLNTPPFLRNVEVEIPKTSAAALPNVSVSEPRAQRIFLGEKSLVTFTVKLRHAGEVGSAKLQLRANGQIVLDQTVDLVNEPETILIQAQWESDPAAWLRGEVLVKAAPDALPGDDRAFFSLAPVVEGSVALLAQSPYLRLAMSPEVMRGQWTARILEPANLATELNGGQDADVLCLESNYLQSGDARKLMWRYLSNGHGVFLVVNRTSPAIDGYLRELGFESEGAVRTGKEAPERFQFVYANHPIFHPFLSSDYGNLTEIRVSEYVRLKGAQVMPLVFSEKGAGLFFQGTKFPGKLFVAAFGLDREHSSWPIHASFIPFLDLTLQTARAEDPTPTSFEPGELAVIQLPAAGNTREVILKGDQSEVGRATVTQGRAQLQLPDRPGLYTLLRDDDSRIEKIFSINPPAKESELVFMDSPAAVNLWRFNHPADAVKAARANPGQIRLAGILQQRLWWWMVIGGLAALVLETTFASTRKVAQ